MLIDDDEDDRAIFCRTLHHINPALTCIGARNGKEGLDYLEEAGNKIPELIFLDINMPIMTGWEFLTMVKQRADLKDTPVIIFSTSAHQRDVEIAYDLGATAYCIKPDDPDSLKQMLQFINRALSSSQLVNIGSTSEAAKFFQFPNHQKNR